jgi:hypothetical protein
LQLPLGFFFFRCLVYGLYEVEGAFGDFQKALAVKTANSGCCGGGVKMFRYSPAKALYRRIDVFLPCHYRPRAPRFAAFTLTTLLLTAFSFILSISRLLAATRASR